MTRPIIVVDVESTSLTPSYADGSGVIWELGLIQYGSPDDPAFRRERLYRMKPDPSRSDEGALAVGKYYERTRDMCADCEHPKCAYDLTEPPFGKAGKPEWSSPSVLALDVARLLDGVTLVASAAHFDAGYLRAYLNHYGQAATWHHRLRDVCSMAWAWLHGRASVFGPDSLPGKIPPFDAGTAEFAVALGVDPGQFEAHSALGDCRLNAAMLDVMTGAA
jgi:hypothetical protein